MKEQHRLATEHDGTSHDRSWQRQPLRSGGFRRRAACMSQLFGGGERKQASVAGLSLMAPIARPPRAIPSAKEERHADWYTRARTVQQLLTHTKKIGQCKKKQTFALLFKPRGFAFLLPLSHRQTPWTPSRIVCKPFIDSALMLYLPHLRHFLQVSLRPGMQLIGVPLLPYALQGHPHV